MCIHLCTSARDLKSLCFWVYFACVCALVHGHCCRHRSPISPNATWQFWIRLLAIQGYSAHHRHTCKCTQVPTYAPITLALHAQTCSTMHSTTLTTNTLTACYMNICCAAAAVSLWGMCVLWSRSAHIRPCFSGLFLKAFLGTVCACAVDGFIHWGY